MKSFWNPVFRQRTNDCVEPKRNSQRRRKLLSNYQELSDVKLFTSLSEEVIQSFLMINSSLSEENFKSFWRKFKVFLEKIKSFWRKLQQSFWKNLQVFLKKIKSFWKKIKSFWRKLKVFLENITSLSEENYNNQSFWK